MRTEVDVPDAGDVGGLGFEVEVEMGLLTA